MRMRGEEMKQKVKKHVYIKCNIESWAFNQNIQKLWSTQDLNINIYNISNIY